MTARRAGRLGLVSLIVALAAAAATLLVASPRAEAVEGSEFTPGMIITDALFFDGTSMSSGAIDEFIAAKNPGCAIGRTCLENYREDVTARAATERCGKISASENRTAGQIIATVAKACGISPKAILTILQKEQSLVTSTAPSSHAFAYAMGAGCPDVGGCNTPNQGLFAQVYYGASLLKWYTIPGSWVYDRYAAGETSSIAYHPDSYDSPARCGFTDVHVENLATHALYVYTPYTPNQAALDNLYGTGNSCSSYGNRNFWRLYNDWFGSTTAGQSLVKAAGSSTVYLLTPDGRWAFDGDVAASEYAGLGKVATVSKSYLNSYAVLGTMSSFFHDPYLDEVWAMYGQERHRVGACGSDLLTGLQVDCETIPTLLREDLLRIDRGERVRPLVETATGELYFIDADGRHRASSEAAPADSGASYAGPVGTLPTELLTRAPRAEIMVADGQAVSNGSNILYRQGSSLGRSGTRLWEQANLDDFIAEPMLVSQADYVVETAYEISGFIRDIDTGTTYMFRESGLTEVGDAAPEEWVREIPGELVPEMPVETGMPPFVTDIGTRLTYFVDVDHGVRLLPDGAKTWEIANAMGLPAYRVKVPTVVLKQLVWGPDMLDFGSVVEVAETGETWFIDGAAVRWRVYSRHGAELSGGTIDQVTEADIAPYDFSGTHATIGLRCLRSAWLVAGGERYELTEEEAAHFEAAFDFRTVQWATCREMDEAGQDGSRVLEKPAGAQFVIEDGVAVRVRRDDDVTALGDPVPVLGPTVRLFG